jgi:hypothetical protein
LADFGIPYNKFLILKMVVNLNFRIRTNFKYHSFSHQDWIGRLQLGEPVSIGYQLLFPSIVMNSDAPKVTSLTFEGIPVCSNGNVATTTAAPTTTLAPGSKQP